MKITLTIILLLFASQSLSQHQFGVKASGGLSYIQNTWTASNTNHKILPTWSANGGLFYNWVLGNENLLGIEFVFNQINGIEKATLQLTDVSGSPAGTLNVNFYRYYSYLTVPIYYGFRMDRINLNVGVQASKMIGNRFRETGIGEHQGDVIQYDNLYKNLTNLNTFDIGPRVGITTHLTYRLSIEGIYYFGLINTFKNAASDRMSRSQQLLAGVRYKIF